LLLIACVYEPASLNQGLGSTQHCILAYPDGFCHRLLGAVQRVISFFQLGRPTEKDKPVHSLYGSAFHYHFAKLGHQFAFFCWAMVSAMMRCRSSGEALAGRLT